jgi:hypothetical protein
VLLLVFDLLYRDLNSPLRKLVGPKSQSLIFENVKEMKVIFILW